MGCGDSKPKVDTKKVKPKTENSIPEVKKEPTKTTKDEKPKETETNSNSKSLPQEEVTSLAQRSNFSEEEVRELYEHYQKISASIDDDGVIDDQEFTQALGLTQSEFAKRLFQVFDDNGDGVVNFEEFLLGLAPFSHKGTIDQKLNFSFKVFDIDGNGGIDKEELYTLLKSSLSDTFLAQLSEEQLRQLVDQTFQEADIDGNGEIDIDEYRDMVNKHPQILNNLQIDLPFFKKK
ncbi:calcineurin b [Anaeramoeba ignava]|uniref:Calcineurin b n=1 Tax=Anaeramoeba ignava TaxID=1746090 RepID=A0A9Q0R7M6_ANAIG|nr:calcineurin b [Anaeramoeba ignava]|eukprot:Anaeramoba_ignava/a478423_326.p1 GENE.a478423_326~~a478423_326.p1  ORF type:complete len:242 (-),score=98.43 a478423_326:54-755(-)